uniref:MARVEL domain-containing protein n=1 Tax=Anopheles culicifacies TaxID=139723 RepID=A0A182M8W3_9DIPT
MQPPQRYIPSVSDLYGTDEIEFLLDEIRDLEPACCQLEDIQDFEIAGSRAGELSISLESPIGTCTSWDSHAHYRQRIGNTPLPWGVALHCDASHLTSPTGIVRILLVVSSAACLACECSAGTVQVGLFLLPLIGRLRLMNAWMYLTIGLLFIVGSSLLIHMVFFAEEFMWVPKHSKDTLFISAILGYICSIEACVLAALTKCPSQYRHVIDEYSDMCLEERELSPICSNDITNHNHTTASNDLSNHRSYNKIETGDSITPTCNQKPYIPVKRPDQSYNQRPTLGNMQKSNHRNRQGYHYQPIASTSRQSPTFVLDEDALPGPSSRSLDYSSA